MKEGVETSRCGFYQVSDGKLIATCIAKSYFAAVTYFEDACLDLEELYEIKVIEILS